MCCSVEWHPQEKRNLSKGALINENMHRQSCHFTTACALCEDQQQVISEAGPKKKEKSGKRLQEKCGFSKETRQRQLYSLDGDE
jgi:hypothetical protein